MAAAAAAANAAGSDDVGAIFAAERGCGTYAGLLWDDALPAQRVFVDDCVEPAKAR